MTKANVEIIEVLTEFGLQEHVIIDRGNGEFTSMSKAFYDEQQAQLTMEGSN
jgi:hypothetical protein